MVTNKITRKSRVFEMKAFSNRRSTRSIEVRQIVLNVQVPGMMISKGKDLQLRTVYRI